MMMSASMGAMGVAIGVAIDEGIAKEVHESYVTSGGDFSELVKAETSTWLASTCNADQTVSKSFCQPSSNLSIKVYRYGFVTTSGEDDPVKAELDIGFVLTEQPELRLNLKNTSDAPKAPLEAVKENGNVTFELLSQSYQILLENYENSLSN